MIWEVEGIEVGHWTEPVARTGCTVVLCPPGGMTASGEVRGGAPATREFALLDPLAQVTRVDAVVLSGGSAFGLAAADGVMEWCEEHGRGVPTVGGRVPIVVGMSLYDLGVGDPSVRPGAAHGRAAAESAGASELGAVGCGSGATVGKWRGRDLAVDGGLVGAVVTEGDVTVAALVAVNAVGDVIGHGRSDEPWPDPGAGLPSPDGGVEAGTTEALFGSADPTIANTTIGVVATNAAIDKVGCHHLARAAHDGLARAITPPHLSVDGDAFVVLSSPHGPDEVPLDRLRLLTVTAVDRALRGLHDVIAGPGSP